MLTKKELDDWFDEHWNIIVDLHISVNNAVRLKKEIYQYEDQIKKHGFFRHHWYQLKFIMIIQLAKLFGESSNQRLNFHKLFNRLTSESYDKEIEDLLKVNADKSMTNVFKSRREIKLTVEQLKEDLKKNQEIIDKVISARDKVYAHLDPKATVKAVKTDELKCLIDLSANVFNSTRGKLYNIDTLFTSTPEWDIDFVLRESSGNRKKELDAFDKLIKGE